MFGCSKDPHQEKATNHKYLSRKKIEGVSFNNNIIYLLETVSLTCTGNQDTILTTH